MKRERRRRTGNSDTTTVGRLAWGIPCDVRGTVKTSLFEDGDGFECATLFYDTLNTRSCLPRKETWHIPCSSLQQQSCSQLDAVLLPRHRTPHFASRMGGRCRHRWGRGSMVSSLGRKVNVSIDTYGVLTYLGPIPVLLSQLRLGHPASTSARRSYRYPPM